MSRVKTWDLDEARRLRASGWSLNRIAEHMRRSRSCIGRGLRGDPEPRKRTSGTPDPPPTRLCVCGCIFHVHSRGFCGNCLRLGRECARFREDVAVPKLAPALNILVTGRDLSGHRKYSARYDR